MAVDLDPLLLLRFNHDSKREQLAREAENVRLRTDNEALVQQLRDERACQDTRMARLQDDHSIALSMLREGQHSSLIRRRSYEV